MPGKRRASIAVWSDPRLLQIANARVTGGSANASSGLAESLKPDFTSADSLHTSNSAIPGGSVEEREIKAIARLLTFLDFRTVFRLRRVSRKWLSAARDPLVTSKVDLNPCNRILNNEGLSRVLTFCGTNIRRLVLRSCWQIGDAGLLQIAEYCPSLENLDLNSCWDITEMGLTAVGRQCPSLRSIDLSNCRKIDDDALNAILSVRPGLESLSLSHCKLLSNNAMLAMSRMCPSLLRLNLQRCTGIGDAGFQHLESSANFAQLLELNLSDCSFLTDAAILALCKACPALLNLNLSFCCGLSETSLELMARSLKRLMSLDLSYCGNAVSDTSVHWIATSLVLLQRLSLRGCVRVTSAGIRDLLHHAKNLRVLNASSCKNVGPEALAAARDLGIRLVENASLESADFIARPRRSTL